MCKFSETQHKKYCFVFREYEKQHQTPIGKCLVDYATSITELGWEPIVLFCLNTKWKQIPFICKPSVYFNLLLFFFFFFYKRWQSPLFQSFFELSQVEQLCCHLNVTWQDIPLEAPRSNFNEDKPKKEKKTLLSKNVWQYVGMIVLPRSIHYCPVATVVSSRQRIVKRWLSLLPDNALRW